MPKPLLPNREVEALLNAALLGNTRPDGTRPTILIVAWMKNEKGVPGAQFQYVSNALDGKDLAEATARLAETIEREYKPVRPAKRH